MSVIDILFRVEEICKRYEKYDIEKQCELNDYDDDAFASLYAFVESEIEAALRVGFSSLNLLFLLFSSFSNYSAKVFGSSNPIVFVRLDVEKEGSRIFLVQGSA